MQGVQKQMRIRLMAAGAATMAVAVGGLGAPLTATASSHREAPLISQDPTADKTDVYAYTHGSNVVLVANYIGLEQPAAGPNFHRFGDDVLYQIHVDNVGDGKSHLDFNFRFTTQNLTDPFGNDTFLYNFGAIHRVSSSPSVPGVNPYSGWLRPQSYTVTAVTTTARAMTRKATPAMGPGHSQACTRRPTRSGLHRRAHHRAPTPTSRSATTTT